LKFETDLDLVRERPKFKTFLAECNRLRHAAGTTAKPELIVLTPTDYPLGEVRPLMIVLHPRGEDFEDLVSLWKHALSKGIVVAFPRSSQLLSSHSPAGMN